MFSGLIRTFNCYITLLLVEMVTIYLLNLEIQLQEECKMSTRVCSDCDYCIGNLTD